MKKTLLMLLLGSLLLSACIVTPESYGPPPGGGFGPSWNTSTMHCWIRYGQEHCVPRWYMR